MGWQEIVRSRPMEGIFVLTLIAVVTKWNTYGEYITLKTDGRGYIVTLEKFGITINERFSVTFQTRACHSVAIFFHRQSSIRSTGSDYYLVLLDSKRGEEHVTEMKLGCYACQSLKTVVGKVLSCKIFTSFWATWDGLGRITFGTGGVFGEHVLLDYHGNAGFRLNMMSLASIKRTAEWRFYKGKPLEFTRPSLDGSTVVVVARDTEVGSTIYTVESNTDSATYAVIGKHRTTFTCDGDKIILVKPLKDKSNNWYGVQIGTDHGIQATLVVKVMDAPVFPSSLVVPEELPTGSHVGDFLTGAHPDTKFWLTGNDSKFFQAFDNGTVVMNQRLDRDGQYGRRNLTLYLHAANSNQSWTSITHVTVADVNDNKPEFTSAVYRLTVKENTQSDTLLLILNYTDDDEGKNAQIFLELSTNHSQNTDAFYIRDNQLFTSTSTLDYEGLGEDNSSFILTILSRDQPERERQNTGTCIIIIQVLPVNEYTPVWESPRLDEQGRFPSVQLSPDTPVGTIVMTTKAVDGDVGDGGDIRYSIYNISTEENSKLTSRSFIIDPISGVLSTSLRFSANPSVKEYNIDITATDQYSEIHGKVTVSIEPKGKGHRHPTFEKGVYLHIVNDVIQPGDTIAHVRVLGVTMFTVVGLVHDSDGEFQVSAIADDLWRVISGKTVFNTGSGIRKIQVAVRDTPGGKIADVTVVIVMCRKDRVSGLNSLESRRHPCQTKIDNSLPSVSSGCECTVPDLEYLSKLITPTKSWKDSQNIKYMTLKMEESKRSESLDNVDSVLNIKSKLHDSNDNPYSFKTFSDILRNKILETSNNGQYSKVSNGQTILESILTNQLNSKTINAHVLSKRSASLSDNTFSNKDIQNNKQKTNSFEDSVNIPLNKETDMMSKVKDTWTDTDNMKTLSDLRKQVENPRSKFEFQQSKDTSNSDPQTSKVNKNPPIRTGSNIQNNPVSTTLTNTFVNLKSVSGSYAKDLIDIDISKFGLNVNTATPSEPPLFKTTASGLDFNHNTMSKPNELFPSENSMTTASKDDEISSLTTKFNVDHGIGPFFPLSSFETDVLGIHKDTQTDSKSTTIADSDFNERDSANKMTNTADFSTTMLKETSNSDSGVSKHTNVITNHSTDLNSKNITVHQGHKESTEDNFQGFTITPLNSSDNSLGYVPSTYLYPSESSITVNPEGAVENSLTLPEGLNVNNGVDSLSSILDDDEDADSKDSTETSSSEPRQTSTARSESASTEAHMSTSFAISDKNVTISDTSLHTNPDSELDNSFSPSPDATSTNKDHLQSTEANAIQSKGVGSTGSFLAVDHHVNSFFGSGQTEKDNKDTKGNSETKETASETNGHGAEDEASATSRQLTNDVDSALWTKMTTKQFENQHLHSSLLEQESSSRDASKHPPSSKPLSNEVNKNIGRTNSENVISSAGFNDRTPKLILIPVKSSKDGSGVLNLLTKTSHVPLPKTNNVHAKSSQNSATSSSLLLKKISELTTSSGFSDLTSNVLGATEKPTTPGETFLKVTRANGQAGSVTDLVIQVVFGCIAFVLLVLGVVVLLVKYKRCILHRCAVMPGAAGIATNDTDSESLSSSNRQMAVVAKNRKRRLDGSQFSSEISWDDGHPELMVSMESEESLNYSVHKQGRLKFLALSGEKGDKASPTDGISTCRALESLLDKERSLTMDSSNTRVSNGDTSDELLKGGSAFHVSKTYDLTMKVKNKTYIIVDRCNVTSAKSCASSQSVSIVAQSKCGNHGEVIQDNEGHTCEMVFDKNGTIVNPYMSRSDADSKVLSDTDHLSAVTPLKDLKSNSKVKRPLIRRITSAVTPLYTDGDVSGTSAAKVRRLSEDGKLWIKDSSQFYPAKIQVCETPDASSSSIRNKPGGIKDNTQNNGLAASDVDNVFSETTTAADNIVKQTSKEMKATGMKKKPETKEGSLGDIPGRKSLTAKSKSITQLNYPMEKKTGDDNKTNLSNESQTNKCSNDGKCPVLFRTCFGNPTGVSVPDNVQTNGHPDDATKDTSKLFTTTVEPYKVLDEESCLERSLGTTCKEFTTDIVEGNERLKKTSVDIENFSEMIFNDVEQISLEHVARDCIQTKLNQVGLAANVKLNSGSVIKCFNSSREIADVLPTDTMTEEASSLSHKTISSITEKDRHVIETVEQKSLAEDFQNISNKLNLFKESSVKLRKEKDCVHVSTVATGSKMNTDKNDGSKIKQNSAKAMHISGDKSPHPDVVSNKEPSTERSNSKTKKTNTIQKVKVASTVYSKGNLEDVKYNVDSTVNSPCNDKLVGNKADNNVQYNNDCKVTRLDTVSDKGSHKESTKTESCEKPGINKTVSDVQSNHGVTPKECSDSLLVDGSENGSTKVTSCDIVSDVQSNHGMIPKEPCDSLLGSTKLTPCDISVKNITDSSVQCPSESCSTESSEQSSSEGCAKSHTISLSARSTGEMSDTLFFDTESEAHNTDTGDQCVERIKDETLSDHSKVITSVEKLLTEPSNSRFTDSSGNDGYGDKNEIVAEQCSQTKKEFLIMVSNDKPGRTFPKEILSDEDEITLYSQGSSDTLSQKRKRLKRKTTPTLIKKELSDFTFCGAALLPVRHEQGTRSKTDSELQCRRKTNTATKNRANTNDSRVIKKLKSTLTLPDIEQFIKHTATLEAYSSIVKSTYKNDSSKKRQQGKEASLCPRHNVIPLKEVYSPFERTSHGSFRVGKSSKIKRKPDLSKSLLTSETFIITKGNSARLKQNASARKTKYPTPTTKASLNVTSSMKWQASKTSVRSCAASVVRRGAESQRSKAEEVSSLTQRAARQQVSFQRQTLTRKTYNTKMKLPDWNQSTRASHLGISDKPRKTRVSNQTSHLSAKPSEPRVSKQLDNQASYRSVHHVGSMKSRSENLEVKPYERGCTTGSCMNDIPPERALQLPVLPKDRTFNVEDFKMNSLPSQPCTSSGPPKIVRGQTYVMAQLENM